jgi:hypothetical protein
MTTLPNLITQLILADEPGSGGGGGDTGRGGDKAMTTMEIGGGLGIVGMAHTASLNSSSSISSNASSSINQQSSPIEASSSTSSNSISSNSNLTLNETENVAPATSEITTANNLIDSSCNSNSNNLTPRYGGTGDLANSMYNQSFLTSRSSNNNNNNEMEIADSGSTSVRVAVRIRPLSTREQIELCKVCTNVTANEPQVTLGSKGDKSFTYDYVFDRSETQERIFEECVRLLVDGCLDGYNATVLAYGQTGSGKTYSMGTSFDESLLPEEEGIIPRAIVYLFERIEATRRQCMMTGVPVPTFSIVAQFMELYNEEINDLFAHLPAATGVVAVDGFDSLQVTNGELVANNGSGSGRPSTTGAASYGKAKIEIHEDQNGAINLSNISMRDVKSAGEVKFSEFFTSVLTIKKKKSR